MTKHNVRLIAASIILSGAMIGCAINENSPVILGIPLGLVIGVLAWRGQ